MKPERNRCVCSSETYVFTVGKKLDIDVCKDCQCLSLGLTKGFMNLYEAYEVIHLDLTGGLFFMDGLILEV